ncbi:hypothetical protein GCM10009739_23800 [Microbacterium ulmi]
MWEAHGARYRMYTFSGPRYTVETFDLRDTTLDRALEMGAIATRSGMLWALALVVDAERGRGLVWLSGMDYHDHPRTAAEWQQRRRMQDRYLAERSSRRERVTLPDGRRVIRLMPEWGVTWPLWESFTDAHLLDAADLGLSDELSEALRAWNAEWNDRSETEPLRDRAAWLAEGRRLHAALQAEVAAFAEVRPEFGGEGEP